MTELVVTDLTRFRNRDIVCVAGLDRRTRVCIRPLTANRPHYLPYEFVKRHNVQPGSVLSGQFTTQNQPPPHTEDYLADIQRVGPQVSSEEFETLLMSSAVRNLKDGFGHLPNNRVFDLAKPPPRSIITLLLEAPSRQIKIVVDRYDETKIKGHITDAAGESLSFAPITDLGFHDHVSALKKDDPGLVKLNSFLQKQKTIMVRVGLSRSFEQSAERKGYWVQLNGIYSFPNYRTDLRSYV